MADLRSTLLPYSDPPAAGTSTSGAPAQQHACMDADMQADWRQDLDALRRCMRSAKSFAVINATLEKWSLATGYLSLTWATAVLLSGHVSHMDLWDFWVVTVILTVGAARTLVVSATSRLTKLWEAGCTNLGEGHVLPLGGDGAPRGSLGVIKLVAMGVACALSCFRMSALFRGGPYVSGQPYSPANSPATLPPSLYIYYSTVLVEAGVLAVAVVHRYRSIALKKGFFLRCAKSKGQRHIATQALVWRLFARHVLDACITGSIFDGMQCHYVAFLVKQAVFHWKRAPAPASPPASAAAEWSQDGSGDCSAETDKHGAGGGGGVRGVEEREEGELVVPTSGQRRAAELVAVLQQRGTALERFTLRWLLLHDEGVRFWHQELHARGAGLEGLTSMGGSFHLDSGWE